MRLTQSTLTGLSACLFIGFVVVLFVDLYHEAIRTGPLLWLAGVLLIATIVSWVAAARVANPGA